MSAAAAPQLSMAVIRSARPSDAPAASELIYLPMGRLADYLFGSDDSARARETLSGLFARPGNRFSYQFSEVLEIDGLVGGLLLSFPGAMLQEFAVTTGKHLQQVLGWGGMLRLIRRSIPLMKHKEAEADEYYVYTLAMRPEFQSQGLGKPLLAHAETKAVRMGLGKCSLGVTLDNHGAIRFYERLNYEMVETVRIPKLQEAILYPGYHRMVKRLSPEPA